MTLALSHTPHPAPTGRLARCPWIAGAASVLWLALLAGCGESFGPSESGAGGGSATTTSTTTDTGTTTSTSVPVDPVGCADGVREGLSALDDIAACAGGFDEAGLEAVAACGRLGGDDGSNPNGNGCTAADLCAAGWHICESLDELSARLDGSEECSALSGGFFATLVTADTAGICGEQAAGGVAGCGTAAGLLPADGACTPLTAVMTQAFCDDSGPWVCSSADPVATAKKLSADEGGVLCCR